MLTRSKQTVSKWKLNNEIDSKLHFLQYTSFPTGPVHLHLEFQNENKWTMQLMLMNLYTSQELTKNSGASSPVLEEAHLQGTEVAGVHLLKVVH